MSVNMGDRVRDSITGFKGIVVGISEFLHVCRYVGVQSEDLVDGKPLEVEWFDEQCITAEPR
jgi:hypothetical protein